MDARDDTEVVLVHDWLTGMRGGEKCLEVLCRHWPSARLYTLLCQPGSVSPIIADRPIITSLLHKLPGVQRYYRYLLPFMPAAVERWTLPACKLVVSFSHCVAKGVCPPPGVPHVCYCFTPMRYAWHQRDAYFGSARSWTGSARVRDWLLAKLRAWDRRTAQRVTHFIAISRNVQRRIEECYGRPSTVIYPPVDTDFYTPAPVRRDDYYLVVSAFAPYKRLDLAIEVCNRLRKKLLVIGAGQDGNRLKRLAGPTVHFLGWQPDTVLRDHFRSCRALLFPGEEDFGIVPVEAQACGAPVIALSRGGATETVVPLQSPRPLNHSPEPTGVWFEEPTVQCLQTAMEVFEKRQKHLDPAAARRQALRFHPRRFEEEILSYLAEVIGGKSAPLQRAA